MARDHSPRQCYRFQAGCRVKFWLEHHYLLRQVTVYGSSLPSWVRGLHSQMLELRLPLGKNSSFTLARFNRTSITSPFLLRLITSGPNLMTTAHKRQTEKCPENKHRLQYCAAYR